MSLPRFMVLRSNATGKFLCYGKDKAGGPTLSFSQEIKLPVAAAADQVLEPKKRARGAAQSDPDFHFLKFEVEEAKSAPGLVHIRTCYNNKYWVRISEDTNRMAANADEPEEDQSKWCCTLFKPIFLGDADDDEEAQGYVFANKHGIGKPPQKIQLVHVSELGQHYVGGAGSMLLQQQLAILDSGDEAAGLLTCSSFTAFDIEPTAILPHYMVFMGQDGQCLRHFNDSDLGFVTSDVGASGVAMHILYPEMLTARPIWVRDENFDKLWKIDGTANKVVASKLDTEYGIFFGPVKVGNCVALYNDSIQKFLGRVSEGSYDGLRAAFSTLSDNTYLRVAEPVVTRTVSEPYYDLASARIYGTGDFQMYSDSRSNKTSVEQKGTFEVEYVKSHTATWNQSLTVNIGVTFSMNFNIPWVGSTGVELSTSFESTTEWGGENTEEETIRYTQEVTIPPGKKVTLRVLSTKSTCDVPLVCKVTDQMTDGTTREYTKTDIVFTGINSYNFDTVLDEEDVI